MLRLKIFIFLGFIILGVNSLFATTIILKSGKTIEGNIIEKKDDSIKVDFQGVNLTYFMDEIKSIDGSILATINPEAKEIYLEGCSLTDLGKYEEAAQKMIEAINIDPKYPLTYYNLGIIYNYLGQYNQAIQAFNKTLELNPGEVWAYGNMAKSYYYLGQMDEAIKNLRKAIELKPDYIEAYTRLGLVFLNLSKFEEAIEYSKKSIAIQATAQAYGNLGLAYKAIGKTQAARESLLIARDLFIKDGQSLQAKRIEDDLAGV